MGCRGILAPAHHRRALHDLPLVIAFFKPVEIAAEIGHLAVLPLRIFQIVKGDQIAFDRRHRQLALVREVHHYIADDMVGLGKALYRLHQVLAKCMRSRGLCPVGDTGFRPVA